MPDGKRRDKMFDRQEAERLLPLIENLLHGAVQNKKQLEEVEGEFTQVQNRILLYGGILPPYRYLAEKKVAREALARALRDAVERIEQTGCLVKDIDVGLVDFPSLVNDEKVYLCWKLGEERIGYWHGMDEGFASRKPLAGTDTPRPDEGKPN
jgi:hypothetical protein